MIAMLFVFLVLLMFLVVFPGNSCNPVDVDRGGLAPFEPEQEYRDIADLLIRFEIAAGLVAACAKRCENRVNPCYVLVGRRGNDSALESPVLFCVSPWARSVQPSPQTVSTFA